MILRAATPADGPAVARVFAAARAEMTYLPELHTMAEHLVYFAGVVADSTTLVAVDEHDAVCGFCAVEDGWLNHLYVLPAHQGQGVGSALLRTAQAASPVLDAWVFQKNAGALRFYARHGFLEVERTDGHLNEEREPDVRIRCGAPTPAA